ncbi:MAG: LpxI family protein [Opitutales bacterium]|nr:LpxI family protein [Opitutales bacterium]MBP3358615.1 UDP-2,3-diacylglucosamine diphosphatase LpxI [Opitutales bacterium]
MEKLSQFLPDNYDKTAKLAILAGKGEYPSILKDKLDALGIPNVLMAFEDETSQELWERYPDGERYCTNVGQLGHLLKNLKKVGAKYAIMAGQITPKKLFKGLKLDLKATIIMATLKRKNAETIFGAIANELSKIDVEMLDARSFLDDDLAPLGSFCGKKPSVLPEHIEHGMNIARECARLDIGQGCVVSRGTVVAVEAFEGTDVMIERAGTFGAKDCIFAKTVKPNQDYRFDVPVIGERTIRKLANANIKNVVVEANKVIILQKELVKKLAEENEIKIFGI